MARRAPTKHLLAARNICIGILNVTDRVNLRFRSPIAETRATILVLKETGVNRDHSPKT